MRDVPNTLLKRPNCYPCRERPPIFFLASATQLLIALLTKDVQQVFSFMLGFPVECEIFFKESYQGMQVIEGVLISE